VQSGEEAVQLWGVLILLCLIAAYAARNAKDVLVPVVLALVPISIGWLSSYPGIGISIAVIEIVYAAIRKDWRTFRRKEKEAVAAPKKITPKPRKKKSRR